ncbi:MAG: GtrA family protein [Chloroflexia bacterium]|nr:GtrA family protein [Chloroflexia bacterium]MDQ3411865.1 GtrA family protein [Chloroflexota bacterium]
MQSTESWTRPALRVWTLTQRFQKFVVVGAIGLVVNQGMLYLLVSMTDVALALASPVSIVISMIVTFTLNELWTWHDRGHGRVGQRAVMYGTINSGGLLINAGILLFLHGHGIHYLLANLVGAGLAAIWNFGLNNMITWRK